MWTHIFAPGLKTVFPVIKQNSSVICKANMDHLLLPFSWVHIDMVGPVTTSSYYSHIVSFIRKFISWSSVYSIKKLRRDHYQSCYRTLGCSYRRSKNDFDWSKFLECFQTFIISLNKITTFPTFTNSLVERIHHQLKVALASQRDTTNAESTYKQFYLDYCPRLHWH